MQSSLEIKDERGKIEIIATLHVFQFGQTDLQGNAYRYDMRVYHTPKGKRKSEYNNAIATNEEILKAKLMLWESIKPQ